MRKLVVMSLFVITSIAYAQEKNEVEKKDNNEKGSKEIFFQEQAKYLLEGGGIWVAENPSYEKDKKYDAKEYKYVITNGVHGENLNIQIKSDINDIGWYLSWNGYYWWKPQQQEVIYHSLSANGASADGTVYTPDKATRINIFKVTSYDRQISWHKDLSKVIGPDEILSMSYKQNPKGEWIHDQSLTWKRIKGEGE